MSDFTYLGNPNLKKANVQQEWTEDQVKEYAQCMKDPLYFIQKYVRIVSLDEGLIPFEMYPFQKEMVGTFHKNRFTICKLPRQSGKSTTMISYLLHYSLFNPSVNIAILANKAATARDLLGRLQLAYEHLPKWLQQGVMSWNKGSLELENGSKILASSTSASAVRGGSYNIIFLDEFAYVPSNVAEQFFSSVYPTISSGKSTKVMIVSTPHGMNMFYKLWTDAEELVVMRSGEKKLSQTQVNNSFKQNLSVSFLGLSIHSSHHTNLELLHIKHHYNLMLDLTYTNNHKKTIPTLSLLMCQEELKMITLHMLFLT